MRVLLLFSSGELGGAERSLSRMAMASSGIDYTLATLGEEGPWAEWIRSQDRIPVVFGKQEGARKSGMTRAIIRLIRFLRRHSVDVIYVCGARAAFILRFLRFLFPKIRLLHGVRWNPDTSSSLDRFFRFMERGTHFLVHGWIVNSDVTRDTLIDKCGIPENRVFTIYNGLESLPEKTPILEKRPMEILTVANLNPRKGHKAYLKVIHQVIEKVPTARFVFVGRDDMNGEIQSAIVHEKLGAFVKYEGFCSDVSPWFQRARLFVLPSLWGEGCPTSILEAFANKVPVLAYSIDGIPELVSHQKDGLLIRRNDDKGLADAIVSLLLDSSTAHKLGVSGREKIEQRFSLNQCISAHESCIKRMMGMDVSQQ